MIYNNTIKVNDILFRSGERYMLNVALHNLGCKVNSYELDVIQQDLQKKGYTIVPFDTLADIYIINTCTVTNIADRKSRQMLHQAKKRNEEAIVVALGCYVQTGMEDVLKDSGIDLAIGNNKKKDTIAIIEEFMCKRYNGDEVSKTLNDSSIININETYEYERMKLEHSAEHTRAYIKIQDGCNQFCTYCIIPFARGRVRSRQVEDIISEIAGLVKKGHKEVVLTGIHISSYGIDFEDEAFANGKCIDKEKDNNRLDYSGETKLMELVEAIHKIEGLERIRLGSLEPRIITEECAKRLARLEKVCPHFHLSLQSGCDSTLKKMNRRYDTREFSTSVEALRKVYKNPAITTDIIVGFPGETEQDFEVTEKYLRDIKLYEMHIFKYSIRKNTQAAKMKEQVLEKDKTSRSGRLLALEQELSHQYREMYIGKEVVVLFEEAKEFDGEKYMIGHTREYLKVAVKFEENLVNQIKKVKLQEFLGETIVFGELF